MIWRSIVGLDLKISHLLCISGTCWERRNEEITRRRIDWRRADCYLVCFRRQYRRLRCVAIKCWRKCQRIPYELSGVWLVWTISFGVDHGNSETGAMRRHLEFSYTAEPGDVVTCRAAPAYAAPLRDRAATLPSRNRQPSRVPRHVPA